MNRIENNRAVDIIIPVYNALEDLKKCLSSVEKHTDLVQNRVIIVNDNSSDPEVMKFLDSLNHPGIIVFHNSENKGFSANINKGMEQSMTNDVLLLNSDTVVTKGWIEKILDCAYSCKTIGTVTPLSNNATLCSVPDFCCENILPEYLDIDKAAEIVEKCSMKKYPRITVAHGFCMFIKREVINKIGGFDAETFQRGYGEENDFCNRAEQMGYIHAMCDDTYIYHSGTKSFISKEKEKLIRDHEKILYDRYPIQMKGNALYCHNNPNGYIAENVGLYYQLRNGKKNLLYMIHSDFKAGKDNNVGGTQFHVKDLKNGLSKEYNVFVAARNMEYLTVTAYIDETELSFDFYIGEVDKFIRESNRQIRDVLDAILEAFAIDLIHVHHVITLSFDIFDLAKEKNIPLILTAHDFYFVCPTIKLINADGIPCCNNIHCETCGECLRSVTGISERIPYLEQWREKAAEYLGGCSKIIFPSESAKNIYAKIYPMLQSRFEVVEHGMNMTQETDIFTVEKERESLEWEFQKVKNNAGSCVITGVVKSEVFNKNTERCYLKLKKDEKNIKYIPVSMSESNFRRGVEAKFSAAFSLEENWSGNVNASIVAFDGTYTYVAKRAKTILEIPRSKEQYSMRVAFIGGLDISKGSQVVYDIISKGSDKVHWFTFGTVGDLKLQNLMKDNYTAVGSYQPQDLKHLIELYQIDLIGVLSIWPETYSYTLSEAIVNRVPLIVTDAGALGERIDKYKCGYKVSVERAAEEFLQHTELLLKDSRRLDDLKKAVKEIQLCSMEKMLKAYEHLYNSVLEQKDEKNWSGNFDKEKIYQAYHSTTLMPGCSADQSEQLDYLVKEVKDYQVLKSTLTYQIVMGIINMKFPYKKQIMDWIYKLLRKS